MLKTPVVVVFLSGPVASAPRNCAFVNPASVVPCSITVFVNATFAEPSTLFPASRRAVVHFAADPVVFWLNVGKLVRLTALKVGAV